LIMNNAVAMIAAGVGWQAPARASTIARTRQRVHLFSTSKCRLSTTPSSTSSVAAELRRGADAWANLSKNSFCRQPRDLAEARRQPQFFPHRRRCLHPASTDAFEILRGDVHSPHFVPASCRGGETLPLRAVPPRHRLDIPLNLIPSTASLTSAPSASSRVCSMSALHLLALPNRQFADQRRRIRWAGLAFDAGALKLQLTHGQVTSIPIAADHAAGLSKRPGELDEWIFETSHAYLRRRRALRARRLDTVSTLPRRPGPISLAPRRRGRSFFRG